MRDAAAAVVALAELPEPHAVSADAAIMAANAMDNTFFFIIVSPLFSIRFDLSEAGSGRPQFG